MFIFCQINQDFGRLLVEVSDEITGKPIEGATIMIYQFEKPDLLIHSIKSDINGKSQIIDLPAPPLEYSMQPTNNLPYSRYNLKVIAPGYKILEIYGTQIFPNNLSIQPAELPPIDHFGNKKIVIIGPNTLD